MYLGKFREAYRVVTLEKFMFIMPVAKYGIYFLHVWFSHHVHAHNDCFPVYN